MKAGPKPPPHPPRTKDRRLGGAQDARTLGPVPARQPPRPTGLVPNPIQTPEGLQLLHSPQLPPFSVLHLPHSLEACVGGTLPQLSRTL